MPDRLRVRVFVDFWNFQLSLRHIEPEPRVDWSKLGRILAGAARDLADPDRPVSFEGLHVYGSYDPSKPADQKLRNWFTNTLDRMAGVQVSLQERQRKRGFPRCPVCQHEVQACPSCRSDMRGTEEKGVDTRLATDMIRLAWTDSYDCAVLVSSDRDFVPVAEFLQSRNIKVIHGAFPPQGSALSQTCWGNLSLPRLRQDFLRPAPTASP